MDLLVSGDDDYDDFFSDAADTDGPSGTDAPAQSPVPPRLGLLADLPPDAFDAIARGAQLKFLEAGTTVFEQGEPADRFFILVEGAVEVLRDGELLASLGPGSFFGETALAVGGARTATVRISQGAALWSIDYATFREVVADHLHAQEDVRREMDARLESLDER